MKNRKIILKRIGQDNKGFSLVELIIVITIMAVLTGLIGTQFHKYIVRANKTRDIYTADMIGNAYMVAAAVHPEVYGLMEEWRTSAHSNLHRTVSVTVDGVTESYRVALIVASENTTWTGGQGEYRTSGFYDTMNEELGLDTSPGAYNASMVPKYKAKRTGPHPEGGGRTFQKVDRWRIVERIDNGQIEVWSADGTRFGGWPQYRVWPVPDDEYTK